MDINTLPADHRDTLRWFQEHAGQTITWAAIKEHSPRLSTQAKGIYKPQGLEYAVSVKQTLSGEYPDLDPIHHSDGSWTYRYFQENQDPAQRDNEYTNVSLMACIRDQIPVGVMIQATPKPGVTYKILGLATVKVWDDGYFYLENYSEHKEDTAGPGSQISMLSQQAEETAFEEGAFDPKTTTDSRERAIASIVRRRGQKQFRKDLIEAYSGQCAITGCNAVEALEAAHITPYKGDETNHVSNGLLLRSDIHTLWDLGLIAIHPDSLQVLLSTSLSSTTYADLESKKVKMPSQETKAPSDKVLQAHREWSGL